MPARVILAVLLSVFVSSFAAAQTQRQGQTLGAKPPAPSEAETNSDAGGKGSSQLTCEGQADKQSLRGKKRKAFLKKCNAPQ